MRGDQVVEHQQIDPSFTLLNEDKSLTFCNSVYSANPAAFFKNVDKSIAGVAHNPAAADKEANDGMIYASCLPWIDFTSISHPMKVDNTDCIPRISWGKFTCTNNRWFMPVSIQLHHGLADGYHVGLFFEKLEELLKTTDQLNWPL